MQAAANFIQVLERRRGLAISITTVAGLLIGLGFSLEQSEQPYRNRSVSRLIADLQKRDSRLGPLLREVMGDRYAPTPAINVRLNAAAELRRREPKPTNALPVLRLLLRGPDLVMRGAALEVLQGLGTAAHSLAPDVRTFVEDQAASTIDVRVQAITALA